MIETRLLHYFMTVVKENNITKAAESLHISQPTLSKQLMELERQVGKQLLIRGKRSLSLTEDGKLLQYRANEILRLLEQAEEMLAQNQGGFSGDLHIGCAESPVTAEVARIFRDLHIEHPRARLHIYAENANTIMEQLDAGLLELGLFTGPELHDRYDYRPLPIYDHWGLLVREDDPLASRTCVCTEDLYQVPLVFPNRIYVSPWTPADFTIDRSALQVVGTYNHVSSARHMVLQGVGCGFCLKEKLTHEMNMTGLTFLPLEPRIQVRLSIVTKKNATLSPLAAEFLTRLRQELE